MKYYAGIGSRSSPNDILSMMEMLGALLARKGFCLRSGGADGADSAFERGADSVGGAKQIFIPWKGFNGHKGEVYPLPSATADMVRKYHPAPHKLTKAAMTLHARNCQQVLGPNLDSLSSFVLCWTPDGKIIGGTATAIKIALDHNIKVINLGNPTDLQWCIKRIEELKKEYPDV